MDKLYSILLESYKLATDKPILRAMRVSKQSMRVMQDVSGYKPLKLLAAITSKHGKSVSNEYTKPLNTHGRVVSNN